MTRSVRDHRRRSRPGCPRRSAALDRGASVTLLDAADQLGGQYWRHLPRPPREPADARLHHGWDTFSRLRDALEADPRCRVADRARTSGRSSTAPASTVHALARTGRRRATERLTPSGRTRWCSATGAHDRTLPFPGWDLPGVFTAGAAQALAKAEGVALGSRVVVAGAGPFLLPVAASLPPTGAEVLGDLRGQPRSGGCARGWLPRPWQLLGVRGQGRRAGRIRRRSAPPPHPVPPRHARRRRPRQPSAVESVTVARLDADLVTDPRHRAPARRRRGLRQPRLHPAAGTADRRRLRIGADGFVRRRRSTAHHRAPGSSRRARSPASAAPTPHWPRAPSPAIARPAAITGRPDDPRVRAGPRRSRQLRRADRGGARHPPRLARLADRRHPRLPLRGGLVRAHPRRSPRRPGSPGSARSSSAPAPAWASARAGSAAAPSRSCSARERHDDSDRRPIAAPGPARRTRPSIDDSSPIRPATALDTDRPPEKDTCHETHSSTSAASSSPPPSPSRKTRPPPPGSPSTTTSSPRTATS